MFFHLNTRKSCTISAPKIISPVRRAIGVELNSTYRITQVGECVTNHVQKKQVRIVLKIGVDWMNNAIICI